VSVENEDRSSIKNGNEHRKYSIDVPKPDGPGTPKTKAFQRQPHSRDSPDERAKLHQGIRYIGEAADNHQPIGVSCPIGDCFPVMRNTAAIRNAKKAFPKPEKKELRELAMSNRAARLPKP